PWPNRIRDGRYSFAGIDRQLSITEPELGNAIHGLVRWVNWRVVGQSAHRVVLEHVLHPQPGYPFTLVLQAAYTLDDNGLQARITSTNAGTDACPYGVGVHPYLRLATPTIDPLILRAPAATYLTSDER